MSTFDWYGGPTRPHTDGFVNSVAVQVGDEPGGAEDAPAHRRGPGTLESGPKIAVNRIEQALDPDTRPNGRRRLKR